MLSLLAAVTLLIFGTVEGSTWGWGSAGVIASLTGAVAAGGLTVRRAFTQSNAVVEADLFKSREFATASAALFLFFIAFATLLLISVLFLQDMWHYSAMDAGLGIAPGPLTAAVFAINSGRISTRFGRAIPALLGASAMALSGLYWLLLAPASPDCSPPTARPPARPCSTWRARSDRRSASPCSSRCWRRSTPIRCGSSTALGGCSSAPPRRPRSCCWSKACSARTLANHYGVSAATRLSSRAQRARALIPQSNRQTY
jgi:hypothetical protein